MAVRTDMGKIRSAIEAGIKAYSNINFSPEEDVTFKILDQNRPSGDWYEDDRIRDIFIMAIHKWGDTSNKVGK